VLVPGKAARQEHAQILNPGPGRPFRLAFGGTTQLKVERAVQSGAKIWCTWRSVSTARALPTEAIRVPPL
jgi:hypothetical protein